MASRRVPIILGGGAAAAAGYYLYNAGGNPKVAEKQAEHDAARLSSKVRGELPGKGKEAKTEAKVYGEQAGQKLDSTINDAKAQANKMDAKIEGYRQKAETKIDEYRKETGKDLSQAVDKFDKTVEQGAAKSKSWLSSWTGGK